MCGLLRAWLAALCPSAHLPIICPSCARRTVSADPSMHEECFRGAKFLLRLLEGIGCEVKLAQVGAAVLRCWAVLWCGVLWIL